MKSKKRGRRVIIILIMIFTTVLAVEKINRPSPLTYAEAVEKISKNDDKLLITFSNDVRDYELNSYNGLDSTGGKVEMSEVVIIAWKSSLNKYLSPSSKIETIDLNKIDNILYSEISKSGSNKVIYEKVESSGGSSLLPRLTMNYYLMSAAILALLSLVSTFLFKNSKQLKQVAIIICIFSTSYIISSVFVLGFNQTTYFLTRDLAYTGVLSILLFVVSYNLIASHKVKRLIKRKSFFISL